MRMDLDTWEEILITITRNKTRSLLTAFGIFWGVFMLVVLMGGGQGMQDMMQANFKGFATNSAFIWPQRTGEPYKGFRKGRSWSMNNNDVERVRQRVPEIDVITPTIVRGGITAIYGEKKTTCVLKGLHPEYDRIETQKISYGRFINDIDVLEARKVCVLGKRIYESLFSKGQNPCGKYVRVNSIYYQIIGVCISEGNVNIGGQASESIVIPFSTMQQAYDMGADIDLICLTAKPGIQITDVQPKVDEVIKEAHCVSPDDKQAIMMLNAEAMFSMIDNLFTGIRILIWLVGIGTLFAGAIGVSNIMMVTVKERTTELGIRRAIGARPRDILQQILSESMVLTIIAGMAGITFAVLMLQIVEVGVNSTREDYACFQVSFWMAIGSGALLLTLGGLAGLAPAYRAMSIKPIDAIRDE